MSDRDVPLQVFGESAPVGGGDAAPVVDGAAPEAIYAHIPFCRHKCHYCDFYSLVDRRDRFDDFVERFLGEVATLAGRLDTGGIRTAFVGGGTPTMLPPEGLKQVLTAVASLAGPSGLEEFTVEANPETVSEEVAGALVDAGVDRVSIGCQSFDPRHLETLERHHDPASVAVAVDRLRRAGIRRLNLDLIFGIPGSTLEDLDRDLDRVLELGPEHVSCYGLVFEPGTPLEEKRRLGRLEPIDQEIEAAMYERVRARLAEAGFDHYEISNWARPGEACRHNLVYWMLGEWVAIGPAAAGNLRGVRYRNLPRLDDWLAGEGLSTVVDVERPEPSVARGERLMLGLRLRRGLSRPVVEEIGLADPARRAVIERHIAEERLEWSDDHLRIRGDSIMMADDVLADLVQPPDEPLSR